VHHVFVPISDVDSAVVPHKNTLAIDDIVVPVADVFVAVRPLVQPEPMLLGVAVLTLVLGLILPSLLSVPMLLVLLPVAHVHRPVEVLVDSEPVSLVVIPLAVVDVALDMVEAASALGLVVFPEALVFGSVLPGLHTEAVLGAAILKHLALVDGTVWVYKVVLVQKLLIFDFSSAEQILVACIHSHELSSHGSLDLHDMFSVVFAKLVEHSLVKVSSVDV
jgi:hypothetical protein